VDASLFRALLYFVCAFTSKAQKFVAEGGLLDTG
jgi:hypothetical protein